MARFARETPWDIDFIRSVLPHRFPFLLVDRVTKLIEGGTDADRVGSEIFGLKNVTINEPFFPGHFPERPIMPGVLIIEALAQACALICVRPLPSGAKRWDFYIVGIKDCKFRRPVVPGDQLELHAKCLRDRPSLNLFHAEALIDGQVVAEAEIQAKMIAVS
jgi:3-hydroxyacyl-[acyl-carrier-protein] dehydratase